MTIEKIVVSCVNMNIKHKNLIEKLDLLVCDDFHPNYVSILIITTILLITTTFFHLINIHNVDTLILITGIFIGIVLSLPLPLTYIRKIMLLFLIMLPIATITALLSCISPMIQFICILLWIIFFVSCNLLGNSLKTLSFVGVLYYLYTFHIAFSNIDFNITLSSMLWYGLVTILIVIIEFMPYILYCLYKHDPVGRKILTSLFKNEDKFYKKLEILYKTHDTYTSNIIYVALLLKSNKKVCDYLYNQYKIRQLETLDKITQTLTSNIIEIINTPHRHVLDTEELEDLYATTTDMRIKNLIDRYIKAYDVFNNIQEGKYIHLDVEKSMKTTYRRDYLTLENNDIRYGIQFMITFILSRIIDVFFVTFHSTTITTSALFTTKNTLSYTVDKILMKIFGNIIGLVFAIVVSTIIIHYNQLYLLNILCVMCVLLLFGFIPNHSDKSGFLVMAILVFISKNQFVGLNRITYVVIGCMISLIIGYYIFPIHEKINMTQTVTKKIGHINNLLENILKTESIEGELHEIFIINSKIKTHLERLENTYHLESEVEDIREIHAMTNNLLEVIINLKLEIKNTQSNNLIKQVNENFKTCINSIDSNKTININEITVPMSNKTPLREYNLWIMEYASIIVDEINKSIENETFKKLNQNL